MATQSSDSEMKRVINVLLLLPMNKQTNIETIMKNMTSFAEVMTHNNCGILNMDSTKNTQLIPMA